MNISRYYSIVAVLLLLSLFRCSSADATVELENKVARLEATIVELKADKAANRHFVDSLTASFLDVQVLLDSIASPAGISATAQLTPVEKIAYLDSLLSASQQRIADLTDNLGVSADASYVKAGTVLSEQLQKQVLALQGQVYDLRKDNRRLTTTLATNRRNLKTAKNAFEMADSSRRQLQTILDVQSDRVTNLNRELDLAEIEKERVARNALALNAFEKGMLYLNQIDAMTTKRGKIKKRDRRRAEILAIDAKAQFNKSLRLGHQPANSMLAKMNYTGVYPGLLGIKPAD